MGRNNQKRRAEKKRKAQRDSRGGWSGSRAGGFGPIPDRWVIEMTASAGARAARAGDEMAARSAVETLAGCALASTGGFVTRIVADLLAAGLAATWEGGWQPSEVARQVRRRRRDAHVALLTSALPLPACWVKAGGAPPPHAWERQLTDLQAGGGAGDNGWLAGKVAAPAPEWRDGALVALELLGELMDLPVIEAVIPPPSAWDRVAPGGEAVSDDRVLAKVRALLAKAESTGFGAEAEALTAKAQELMARHALDGALVRAAQPHGEVPVMRRIAVDEPYALAKSTLLRVVALVNGARTVWYSEMAAMAVVGYRADLDAVEVLFTSLLVQASNAMLDKGSVVDRMGRSRTRSFRQSFLLAYASRIRERLEMAAHAGQQEAEAGRGASLVPVLMARDDEVDEALGRAFPHLEMVSGPTATNQDGWRAGRVAAELATLGPRQTMLDGMAAAG